MNVINQRESRNELNSVFIFPFFLHFLFLFQISRRKRNLISSFFFFLFSSSRVGRTKRLFFFSSSSSIPFVSKRKIAWKKMGMNSYFFFFPSSYLLYWRKEEELGHHFPAHPPPKIPFSQKEQYDEKKNEISPFSISSSSSISPKKEKTAKRKREHLHFFLSFLLFLQEKTERIGNEINPLFFPCLLHFFYFQNSNGEMGISSSPSSFYPLAEENRRNVITFSRLPLFLEKKKDRSHTPFPAHLLF